MENQRKRLKDRGICVIIPTFDNAGTIADVVVRAQKQCDDVIVVCDGCTDDTLLILKALPVSPEIISFPENRGKGAALKAGFRYALDKGFSYAITLDGDGQHFPEDIPCMLDANLRHPGALILGQRKGLENIERSAGSRFANSFSNFWFALQTGHYLKDTQTGYRLYPLKKLYGLSLLTSRYEAELELPVFASWHGVKLVSEPVNVYYPSPDERVSHFRPVRDFARIFILNTILCILAVVYGLPLAILRGVDVFVRSFMLGFSFVFFSLLVMTPFAWLYIGLGRKTEKKVMNLHKVIHYYAKFAIRHIPGVKYTSSNPTCENFDSPAVVICNHQSHLDLLAVLSLTPKLVILTNDWVWKDPLYGYIIRNTGFLPVSSGLDAIMPKLEELVSQGYSIAVYPEGTRSSDGDIGRFHQGAFYIARTLRADMVPAIIYGASRALPKHREVLHRWPIFFEIGERLSPDDLDSLGETLKQQASAMRNSYRRRYSEIADKIERNV